MKLLSRIIVLSFVILASSGATALAEIERYIESPKPVGAGTFRVAFFKLYDAELYAANGVYEEQAPFALRLTYARNIPGTMIAEKSIELIEDFGVNDTSRLERWSERLNAVFPDVKKGGVITGIKTSDGASFYYDGTFTGELVDAELVNYFFAIWLSEQTTAPQLRAALLNLE